MANINLKDIAQAAAQPQTLKEYLKEQLDQGSGHRASILSVMILQKEHEAPLKDAGGLPDGETLRKNLATAILSGEGQDAVLDDLVAVAERHNIKPTDVIKQIEMINHLTSAGLTERAPTEP